MANVKTDDIRNIALCGHRACGKTTLADKMLMVTGTISAEASVDNGSSVCDFDEAEKHHKYTIESSLIHFNHAGKLFQVIDTPGSPDFIGQTIGALRGVDTVAIVIDAHSGMGVNTRRVFQEAGNAGLGRIIIISKMDTENIEFETLIDEIQELWGKICVPLNVPVGHGADFKGVLSTLKVPEDTSGALIDPASISDSLIESIIEVDEQVTERYFEGQQPTEEELARLIPKAIIEESLIPILCVSGETNVGLTELLDALAVCAVPPPAIERTASKDGEKITIEPSADGPLIGQVFKTRIDPFVQKLSFVRIFSGTLAKDTTIAATGARKGLKIHQMFTMQGSETTPVDSAGPGQIVAIPKMEELHTGSSVGEYTLPPIQFPSPMVGLAVLPKSRGDEAKLSGSLHKIVEEDSTFKLDRDTQTKELVVTGMSELHLQVIQERLLRRDKVDIETRDPKIPYRETIQATAEGMYRHKKQSGGRGQFGEVHIRLFPFPLGTDPEEYCVKSRFPSMKTYHYTESNNFVWIDSVVGGTIPSNFLPAVEKGFKERITRGIVAGYQVQNLAIEVHFGKHHPVDSSEQAFKTAASMALRNIFQEAKPGLLEPIVTMHITVPSEKVGDVNSDMSTRRGRMLGMDSAGGGMQTIAAEVPLAEVTTYARNLSSMTGGQGSFAMEFTRYDVVPGNVQKEIMDKAKHQEEEDE